MGDPEDEQDLIGTEHVVHHAVVADPQPVEGVAGAMHRFHGLPLDPADLRRVPCQFLERARQTSANLGSELPERLRCGGAELDAIRVQVSSDMLTVRPWA